MFFFNLMKSYLGAVRILDNATINPNDCPYQLNTDACFLSVRS